MLATTLRTGYGKSEYREFKFKLFDCRLIIAGDLCALNGYPNQKVVFEYEGLRPEDDYGFIYKFSVYEYPLREHHKRRHLHVFQSKQVMKSQTQKSDATKW